MMMDLFDSHEAEHLPVLDAEIFLWRHVDLEINEEELLHRLIRETPWQEEHVKVWGKTYAQPRLVAWYGDGDKSYSYSGVILKAYPLTKTLSMIRHRVEGLCDCSFNSVLLNYYRDHRDGMGFHSDDEPELGPSPTIASLTLGEVRKFVLKHKTRKDVKDVKIPLPSGSLLVMKGSTQANWKHGIPKESRPCGPRINLTFRNILG